MSRKLLPDLDRRPGVHGGELGPDEFREPRQIGQRAPNSVFIESCFWPSHNLKVGIRSVVLVY